MDSEKSTQRWWKSLPFIGNRKFRGFLAFIRSQEFHTFMGNQTLLMLLYVGATVCTVGSGVFVDFMNGKTNASRKLFKYIQPTTILNIMSSVYVFCLGAVITHVTTIIWWRTAVRGTQTRKLSQIWEYGTGGVCGIFKAGHQVFGHGKKLKDNWEAETLAVVALIVAVTNFLSGPLLQQAMDVRTQDQVTNRVMKLDFPVRIPDGWSGAINTAKPGNISFSHNFFSIMQQWYRREPITMSGLEQEYFCPGVCTGDVPGAGIIWHCAKATDFLVLNDPYRNGSLVFSTNFDRFDNEWGYPTLRVVAKYVTAVNDSCGASVTIDTCDIWMSTIKYPVIISNQTVRLDMSQLHIVSNDRTYIPIKSTGDSNATKLDWGAGPLTALAGFANAYYLSNATVDYNGTTRIYDIDMKGSLAGLYYDLNDTHYDAITSCARQFSSPTEDILSALHEITFRTALKSNNGTTANFTVEEIDKVPFYYIKRGFWISALSIMSTALLISIIIIFAYPRTEAAFSPKEVPTGGYGGHVTNIEHPISLNPIAVAEAYHRPPEPEDAFLENLVLYHKVSGRGRIQQHPPPKNPKESFTMDPTIP
ncbi:hypothetical protein FGG08_007296 [Glutinoglossum americanum]|uniref:Transmembrane protein n=1 Tax=Glutinoglossum americanum TaxID=1670608 RepID=A0A9P8HUA5_9PEZI|nr:hypothetical protein FGG08_007296 [Glutinoglossum americanum]